MNDREDVIPAHPPSRSQRRREALEVLSIARAALKLPPRLLARLELSDPIRSSIERARRISSRIARKRETGYLAKLLRSDTAATEALAAALARPGLTRDLGGAAAHRATRWVQRLVAEGDAALARLCAAHPRARGLPLRPLILAAQRIADAPPTADPGPVQRLHRLLVTLFATDRSLEEE